MFSIRIEPLVFPARSTTSLPMAAMPRNISRRLPAAGISSPPQRIREANANAKRAGVTRLVSFRQEDLFKADFRNASVVTLYLLPELNEKLRPRLWAELKPGTRIVSHQFDMGDWQPQQKIDVNGRTIYFWTVPERRK